jgi:hypothetical protein
MAHLATFEALPGTRRPRDALTQVPDRGNDVIANPAYPRRLALGKLGMQARIVLRALWPDHALVHDDLLDLVCHLDKKLVGCERPDS